jgi:hypothetical protein
MDVRLHFPVQSSRKVQRSASFSSNNLLWGHYCPQTLKKLSQKLKVSRKSWFTNSATIFINFVKTSVPIFNNIKNSHL